MSNRHVKRDILQVRPSTRGLFFRTALKLTYRNEMRVRRRFATGGTSDKCSIRMVMSAPTGECYFTPEFPNRQLSADQWPQGGKTGADDADAGFDDCPVSHRSPCICSRKFSQSFMAPTENNEDLDLQVGSTAIGELGFVS